jgi:hypothetical protein
MHPLSVHEARQLLEAARDDRLEALYVLAVTTGMRQGELLALKWQDIDLENATASVKRTLTRTGGRYALGGAEDEEEPSLHTPDAASNGHPRAVPGASAMGHTDARRQIRRPGPRL